MIIMKHRKNEKKFPWHSHDMLSRSAMQFMTAREHSALGRRHEWTAMKRAKKIDDTFAHYSSRTTSELENFQTTTPTHKQVCCLLVSALTFNVSTLIEHNWNNRSSVQRSSEKATKPARTDNAHRMNPQRQRRTRPSHKPLVVKSNNNQWDLRRSKIALGFQRMHGVKNFQFTSI